MILMSARTDKQEVLLRLLLILFSLLFGCYTHPKPKSNGGDIYEKVEVVTKSGQSYILVRYEINEIKIIGHDRDGHRYEELLENIQSMTVLAKHSRLGEIYLFTWIVVVASFLYLYSQGFSGRS